MARSRCQAIRGREAGHGHPLLPGSRDRAAPHLEPWHYRGRGRMDPGSVGRGRAIFGRHKAVDRAEVDGPLSEGHLRPGRGWGWRVRGDSLSADGEALERISSATEEA